MADRQARSCIGRWLKDTSDDAERVLGAIQRARDDAIVDPIPWITSGLTKAKARQNARIDRNAEWLSALSADEQPDFIDGDFEVVRADE